MLLILFFQHCSSVFLALISLLGCGMLGNGGSCVGAWLSQQDYQEVQELCVSAAYPSWSCRAVLNALLQDGT